MQNEIKVVLPFYKLAYSFSFIVILNLLRVVTDTCKVGISIEAPAAILVSIFCADTYVQEIVSRKSEIHRLYPMKKRKALIIKRLPCFFVICGLESVDVCGMADNEFNRRR